MEVSKKNFDSELQAYFGSIKHAIKQEHVDYLKTHPELRQILNDFLSSCLLEQPEDIYDYAKKYFAYFNYSRDTVKHKPLVISGCSGVGKGTIMNLLLTKYPEIFELSISYTTRSPRQGEMHGREYYFVSKEEFQKEIDKKVFVEFAKVHENFYGTHKGKMLDIMSRGKICLLDVDVVGASTIDSNGVACEHIFIDAPSMEVLSERLHKRGTETEETIQKRLLNAKNETERGRELQFYHHIMNQDIDKCFADVLTHIRGQYKIVL